MEVKQKAKELIVKYSPLVTTWDCYWDAPRNEDDILKDAKECALICVDEILSINNEIWDNLADSYFEYWQQVKQEILNL